MTGLRRCDMVYRYIDVDINIDKAIDIQLLFAITWMDLEIIILNEVSQTQGDKCCMLSHMWN